MSPPRADNVPIPDPTRLSTEALNREIGHLRELMDGKFTERQLLLDDWATLMNEKFKGVDRTLEELNIRAQQRFDAQTKALDAAFLSAQTAVTAALSAADKGIQAAMMASEKAVTKAEIAAEKRFDSTMEFQKALSEIVREHIPRREAETRFETMGDKFDSKLNDMSMKIDDLKASRDTGAGKSTGISTAWAVGVGAVSLVISVAVFVISFMHKTS